MLGPVVPGWVILLFAIFYLVIGIVVIVLVGLFITSIYELVHPKRNGGWRRPLVLGTLFGVAIAIGVLVTAEDRALRSKVSGVTSISTLSPESFSTRYRGSEQCQIVVADGPPWKGNETRLSETIRRDADAFEADGWAVTRYRASDTRRSQLGFEYEPWLARAIKDDFDVRIGIESQMFRYTLFLGECLGIEPPKPTLATKIERFPAAPEPGSPGTIAATDATLRTVLAQVARSPQKIEQVVAHGIGSRLDCFVSSFRTTVLSDGDLLELLDQRLQADGWTVIDVRNPVVAVKGDEAVVASTSWDYGLWIRSYPPGCVGKDGR